MEMTMRYPLFIISVPKKVSNRIIPSSDFYPLVQHHAIPLVLSSDLPDRSCPNAATNFTQVPALPL